MPSILCLIALLLCGVGFTVTVKAKIHRLDIVNYNDFYSVNISVGSPSQWFSVQLDTATADFWVVDSECPADQCLGREAITHRRYIRTDSKTYESDGTEFLVSNGQRSVWGTIGHEEVKLGDLIVERQAFGRGRLLELQMGVFPIDGVLGLGPPKSAQSGARPLMQTVADSVGLNEFTVWLDKAPRRPNNHAVSGMLTIGGEDTDHCTDNWTPLKRVEKEKRFWAVEMQSVSIGSTEFAQSVTAIIDTATAFISAPSKAFESMLSTLNARRVDLVGLWTVDCRTKYPGIEFELNGKRFSVDSDEYVRKTDIGCVLALGNSSAFGAENFWILGSPFLRRRCVHFDLNGEKIKLANQ